MKQKMKFMVSVISVVLMMVSMLSVCVFPASAASGDEYTNLQASALVVNSDWSGKSAGDPISYTYRGKTVPDTTFDPNWHFASFEDAWARAKALNMSNPVIMICGTYAGEIKIDGGVTLIGANAGIDPVKESDNPNSSWSLSGKYAEDSYIAGSITVAREAGSANITFDGVRFTAGGAFLDYYRNNGSSEITFKNVVFEGAGNADSDGYAMYLFSTGHARNINLENIYVTGQNSQGLISPYFSKLVGKRIAYVNNGQGILNRTSFAAGVAPYIEFTDSCFFNNSAPAGYMISMDNYSCGFTHAINGTVNDVALSSSDQRPNSVLTVSNCTFYNASVGTGVIHYEFINKNSTFNFNGNYVYSSTPTTVLAPEFLLDSLGVDQTSCMHVSNNLLYGAYKVPDLGAANLETYIDVSYNYFADAEGQCVANLIYMNPAKPKAIRSAFWIDPAMTTLNTDPKFKLSVKDWDMYQIDPINFDVILSVYEETGKKTFDPKFAVGEGSELQLYAGATIVEDVIVSLNTPMEKITMADLKENIYETTTFYLQITNSEFPTFAPIYTITVDNVGNIDTAPYFSKEFPGYYMYQPNAAKNAASTMMPYRWQDKVYRMEVGKTLFADAKSLIEYANKQGVDVPTIVVPAGSYTEEFVITGSCNILGEKHGVDPNVKPFDKYTQSNVASAGWTLNPERANDAYETVFNACIRIDAAASDYVVTLDGIKMGEGCSYVDDVNHVPGVANVTIMKNVIADGAGGGKDRNGKDNIYLFNFNKENSMESDMTHFYMYDSRIDHNQKCHVFGPFVEKLVLDNTFYGNSLANGTQNMGFMSVFRSRDVAAPYYSMTNCCLFNNAKSTTNSAGLGACYVIDTQDDLGNQSAKKNIIYNFDNNLFYNAFGSGNAAMEVWFTGSNMKFYLTNNTLVDNTHADTFFAGNQATRWTGNSASYDCSDQLICKGNRFVKINYVPLTHGTGNGTLIDYSGNYWADNLTVANGEKPGELTFASCNNLNETLYPFATTRKVTIDYTYLDWDLTKRSSDPAFSEVTYVMNKGMYGTGTYKTELFDGVEQIVYRDSVPSNCDVYEVPANVGAFCTVKIEKRTGENTYSSASAMELTTTEHTYRVTITSKDGSNSESFIVILKRAKSDQAKLLKVGTGSTSAYSYIDEDAKVVYMHTNSGSYSFKKNLINVSNGATFEIYKDAECKTVHSGSVSITAGTPALRYIMVTSEDGMVQVVYTVQLKRYSNSYPIDLAVVTDISNMTYQGGNVYEGVVDEATKSINIKPTLYRSATAELYSGTTLISPNASGTYALKDLSNGQTFRLVVTANDDVTTKEYTLKFVYGVKNECELIDIEGATKTDSGYVWNLKDANAAYLNATVSKGASYVVYSDSTMLTPFKDNLVVVDEGEGATYYLKVTSSNGKASNIYPISVITHANVSVKPDFFVKVGNTEYKAHLTGYAEYTVIIPEKTEKASISFVTNTSNNDDLTLFAGPDSSVTLASGSSVTLGQGVTTLRYSLNDRALRPVEFEGEELLAGLPLQNGVVKIVSDRAASVYKDAASIPAWAKGYVDFLNKDGYGIITGDGAGNFNPQKYVSRYELAVIACRTMGLDVELYKNVELNYSDKIEDWALPYVRAVTATGIMSGNLDAKTGKVTFNGTKSATREQVAVIMSNIALINDGLIAPGSIIEGAITSGAEYYAKYKNDIDISYNANDFADENKVSEWAVPYIRLAVDYEMLSGSVKEGKLYLNPKAPVSRIQVASMIANYLN